MGRPAKFTQDQMLDAALAILGADGPAAVTMTAVSARTGAPIGSLYHRFASRDLLLATLWLRCVKGFQAGFAAAMADDDVEAAALHTPRWCRANPAAAAALLLYRREDLAAQWPDQLGPELAAVDERTTGALDAYLARHPGTDRQHLMFVLADVPYGAVRRHLLAGRTPPPELDDLILTTCRAVLAAG
ncbi:TetR/AcrR family transcriptional regulator [Nonomuraea sp. NPDC050547]|uniref:TetR/AcrR family transcriptional regulator n=1 Tax=Nonomuraea sp. NPDC050547 TaxID=3364368 RepID=UPI0037873D5F